MRVNRNRLDLRSLLVGVPCVITTGSTSVRILHGHHSVEMGMYLNGVGMRPITEDRLLRIETVKGIPVHWLHLDKLAPRRLYTVLVTSPGRMHEETEPHFTGMPGWQISDDTPDPGPDETRSGGQGWNLLGKLLGRRGE